VYLFDVSEEKEILIFGQKIVLWLATSQDGPSQEVGWIWNLNFEKLDPDALHGQTRAKSRCKPNARIPPEETPKHRPC
jgi:hypothetical protein